MKELPEGYALSKMRFYCIKNIWKCCIHRHEWRKAPGLRSRNNEALL